MLTSFDFIFNPKFSKKNRPNFLIVPFVSIKAELYKYVLLCSICAKKYKLSL